VKGKMLALGARCQGCQRGNPRGLAQDRQVLENQLDLAVDASVDFTAVWAALAVRHW